MRIDAHKNNQDANHNLYQKIFGEQNLQMLYKHDQRGEDGEEMEEEEDMGK